jgi:hypothetical protein
MTTRYSVVYYMNGHLSHTTHHLSKRSAYESAIPNAALLEGSRWHVMLYAPAVQKMGELFVGETLRVCWQEYNANFDTEHILIVREEDSFDNLINNYI